VFIGKLKGSNVLILVDSGLLKWMWSEKNGKIYTKNSVSNKILRSLNKRINE
jgi:hypothetical protein